MRIARELKDPRHVFLDGVKRIAEMLATCEKPVVFTGAGISTDSGVPDYRSGLETQIRTGPGVWMTPENQREGIYKGNRPGVIRAQSALPNLNHVFITELVNRKIAHKVVPI